MNFKFFCPHCGNRIESTTAAVGTSTTCPGCSQVLTIPAPADIAGTEQPPPVQKSPLWSYAWWPRSRKGAIVASTTLILAILIIWMGFLLDGRKRDVERIQQVLQQDVETGQNVATVGDLVQKIRSIDIDGCPNDFRLAYLAHIHAWESVGQVEQRAIAYKKDNPLGSVMLECFIRGAMLDFGKPNEIRTEENQLQTDYQAAAEKVRQTFHRVEEIAVAHGASLPKKSPASKN